MKIKICHFTNIITGKSDGVYSHLKMIFKYVDREKYQLYLVFQGNHDIETEVTSMGVKVKVIKSLSNKLSIECFREFYAFVKFEDIDIIHTHFLKPYSIAGLLNIFLRKKMIFNFHGLFIENLYNTEMEKFIYRQIHKIISYFNSVELAIVPSNSSKKILIDETGLFKTIKVYYNGYDGEIADKTDQEIVDYFLELKKTFFLIGIIGRIDIQKRIDIAFEIARKIIKYRNDICFVFVGNGDLDKEMAQKLERMNLGNNAKMLGYVPNAKLYIKYFNLVLFTSDWEGFPLSIWESMAAGVPIVSTDVGGVREILEKEDCGIIYPRRNVDAGVEAILLLLNDNEKLKKMGERGAYAIQSKYNSKSFADFFNNLYSSLAAPDS